MVLLADTTADTIADTAEESEMVNNFSRIQPGLLVDWRQKETKLHELGRDEDAKRVRLIRLQLAAQLAREPLQFDKPENEFMLWQVQVNFRYLYFAAGLSWASIVALLRKQLPKLSERTLRRFRDAPTSIPACNWLKYKHALDRACAAEWRAVHKGSRVPWTAPWRNEFVRYYSDNPIQLTEISVQEKDALVAAGAVHWVAGRDDKVAVRFDHGRECMPPVRRSLAHWPREVPVPMAPRPEERFPD